MQASRVLREVDLSFNDFGVEGAKAIGSALQVSAWGDAFAA